MPKPFNIHASYQGQTQIIEALPDEFLDALHETFSIPVSTKLTIYQVARGRPNKEIAVKNMKDLMRIEVVDHPVQNNSIMEADNLEPNKMDDSARERIIEKLTFNSALTGLEREQMIKLISQSKRKRDVDQNGESKNPSSNKKIQVTPKLIDSAQQTDIKALSKGCFCGGSKDKNGVPSRDSVLLTAEQDKKVMLKLASSSQDKLPDPVKTKELMDATYIARRNFIQVHLPTVRLVKNEYPLLFNTQEIQNELERIFISGKCKSFLQNVAKYSSAVLDMVNDDDIFLKKIKEKVRLCGTVPQKKYAREVGSLLMISSIMNESRAYLKLQNKSGVTPATTNFPYIDANAKLEDLFRESHVFHVYFESVLICKAVGLHEAILCLMATYYAFDVQYQAESYNTLLTFEKIYLEGVETEDIEDYTRQVIKTLQLKVQRKTTL